MTYTIREAALEDLPVLREMLGWAAAWRSDEIDRRVLADPAVSRYVEDFGRTGDVGLIAEDDSGDPVGAAWYRYFSSEEPGFGFVAPDVPEITVAVRPSSRGRGVGTALLRALLARARSAGVGVLSLSVEEDNRALALYERMGFRTSGRRGNALTMRVDLRD